MGPERAPRVRAARGGPWSTKEEGAFLLGAILWLVERLKGPIAAFGVDYPRFRELLRVRVVLTQRATGEGSKAWGQAGVALAIVMTWLVGLGTGLTALVSADAGPWILLSQSALMVLLAAMLFQVLVGVLVDPTDIGVVVPHPISDRTVFAVRLAEVAAYVLILTATFTAGNLFLAVFGKPVISVLLVYPLLSCLCAATTLGLVTLLFSACLRIAGPTHFQRATLWLQILGGVGIFLLFQAPRLVHREQWGLWFEQYAELRHLLPPFQYAEIFAFASGTSEGVPIIAILLAFLFPVAALLVTFLLASRFFVAGLHGTLGTPARRSGWELGLLNRIGGLWGREERAGFDFALALSRREPHFLRAVLPQLVMFQAMAIGSGFGLQREIAYFIPASAGFLFIVLPNILLQAQSTAVPDARALFTTAPLESEDALLRGGVKALLLQWIGVPALVLFVVQLWAGGPGSLPEIVLAFELSFVATLIFIHLFQVGVPFTRSIRVGETGAANIGLILLMGIGMGAVVVLHLLLVLHPVALWGGIAGLGGLLVVLWRRLHGLKVAPDRRLMVPRTRLVLE